MQNDLTQRPTMIDDIIAVLDRAMDHLHEAEPQAGANQDVWREQVADLVLRHMEIRGHMPEVQALLPTMGLNEIASRIDSGIPGDIYAMVEGQWSKVYDSATANCVPWVAQATEANGLRVAAFVVQPEVYVEVDVRSPEIEAGKTLALVDGEKMLVTHRHTTESVNGWTVRINVESIGGKTGKSMAFTDTEGPATISIQHFE